MKEPSCLEEDIGPYEPRFCSWCNSELDPEIAFGVGPVNVFCSEECYDEHTERWGWGMSYTNVTITDQYDSLKKARKEIDELNFKLKQASQEIDYLQSVLENIPEAVEQYGYVDITYNKKTIKLVKAVEENND